MDILKELEEWYASLCDGEWEHTYGVLIGNIDNPGWRVTIELADTYLEDVPFEKIKVQRSDENDWFMCTIENFKFEARGGPCNLREILRAFLDWAEKSRSPARQH